MTAARVEVCQHPIRFVHAVDTTTVGRLSYLARVTIRASDGGTTRELLVKMVIWSVPSTRVEESTRKRTFANTRLCDDRGRRRCIQAAVNVALASRAPESGQYVVLLRAEACFERPKNILANRASAERGARTRHSRVADVTEKACRLRVGVAGRHTVLLLSTTSCSLPTLHHRWLSKAGLLPHGHPCTRSKLKCPNTAAQMQSCGDTMAAWNRMRSPDCCGIVVCCMPPMPLCMAPLIIVGCAMPDCCPMAIPAHAIQALVPQHCCANAVLWVAIRWLLGIGCAHPTAAASLVARNTRTHCQLRLSSQKGSS